MKALLEVDLPEEHGGALDGVKWRAVVNDIANKMRSALKYDDDLTPESSACLENLREELFQLIADRNLNLYE